MIKKGFIAAGLSNILGVLILSRGLTNEVIMLNDPVVMSVFGLLMIVVWGLAYIAVAESFQAVPWLVGVFAVEKLAYVGAWVYWLMHNDLGAVYTQDTMAGIFFTIYGFNDLVFMLFFGWVYFKLEREKG